MRHYSYAAWCKNSATDISRGFCVCVFESAGGPLALMTAVKESPRWMEGKFRKIALPVDIGIRLTVRNDCPDNCWLKLWFATRKLL